MLTVVSATRLDPSLSLFPLDDGHSYGRHYLKAMVTTVEVVITAVTRYDTTRRETVILTKALVKWESFVNGK